MRITKPSFRLKNFGTIVFSNSGKYLAQVGNSGTKVTLWDVAERQVIGQYKVIKNDHHIGFSPDESMMFSKNSDGDVVFFHIPSGEIVSKSKPLGIWGQGGCPQFSQDGKYLFDGTPRNGDYRWDEKKQQWDDKRTGKLLVWSVNTADRQIAWQSSECELSGKMVVSQKNNQYYLAGYQKYSFEKNQRGADIILTFSDKPDENSVQLLSANNPHHRTKDGLWKYIETLFLHDETDTLFIALAADREALMPIPPKIAIRDLLSGEENSITLDKSNQYIWNITANAEVILVAVETNHFRKEWSNQEYEAAKKDLNWSHIYIYDRHTLECLKVINWKNTVYQIAFHPNGTAIAVGADKDAVYLDNYRKLLDWN